MNTIFCGIGWRKISLFIKRYNNGPMPKDKITGKKYNCGFDCKSQWQLKSYE